MEYEFRRNTLTGTVNAVFSMEHEALGMWFTEELADNRRHYLDICQAVNQLQANKLQSWRLVGRSLTLELDNEQARVFVNELNMEMMDEFEESMSLYDSESESFCGLEDFEKALSSWREFLDQSQ